MSVEAIIAEWLRLDPRFCEVIVMQTIWHRQKVNHRVVATRMATALASLLVVVGCRDKGNSAGPEMTSGPIAATAVSTDGVPIHYRVQGTGTPALVFVHGWSCDSSYWNAQLTHFSKQYQVVTIDLAGHGKSGLERAEWTITAFARDVAAVVNKLHLNQVVLVGHSMGADVIVETTRQIPRPVIGLVVVDAFRSLKTQTQEQIKRFIMPFRANFAETTDRFVRSLFAPTSEPDLVEETALDMSTAPREVALACLEALHQWRSEELTEALGKVTVPIVAINSDMRPCDVQGFQSTFPTFKFIIMSGVGHFVMMEDPETFNQLLADTVKELKAAATPP